MTSRYIAEQRCRAKLVEFRHVALRVSLAFILVPLAASCGVSKDKHPADTTLSMPGLVVDDFKLDPGATTTTCYFNDKVWPPRGAGSDAGGAAICQKAGRMNRFGSCPNILAYCNDSNSADCDKGSSQYYGNLCTSYVDQSNNGSEPFIGLTFDVSAPGGEFNDAFACFFEPLTNENGVPLNLVALGLSHVTFWVKASQENTNIEVSLKDSALHETDPKETVAQHLSLPLPNNIWTQVVIPATDLMHRRDDTAVNLASLSGLGFCFAHNHFAELSGNAAMKGEIDINDITFDP